MRKAAQVERGSLGRHLRHVVLSARRRELELFYELLSGAAVEAHCGERVL